MSYEELKKRNAEIIQKNETHTLTRKELRDYSESLSIAVSKSELDRIQFRELFEVVAYAKTV